jgi:methionine-rich copper-binding protein CopC
MKKHILTQALTLALLLALIHGAAQAHVALVESSPAPGAQVGPNLKRIRLRFSDQLGPESSLTLMASNLQPVEGLDLRVDGQELIATLNAPLPIDTYTVQWTAVGPDGDPSQGSYQFAVQQPNRLASPLVWVVTGALVIVFVAAYLWLRRRRSSAGGQPQ